MARGFQAEPGTHPTLEGDAVPQGKGGVPIQGAGSFRAPSDPAMAPDYDELENKALQGATDGVPFDQGGPPGDDDFEKPTNAQFLEMAREASALR